MYMMSDLMKDNIGEQGVADGRHSHSFRTLGNNVVNQEFDVTWLALPGLVIAAKGFSAVSGLSSMPRFLAATRAIKATSICHNDSP
jgi:hypothetical protein